MDKLKKVMCDIFNIRDDEITDDVSMHNTEAWDSLKHIQLIVSIEETYGIKLTGDEVVSMVNMNKIKNVLKEYGLEK